MSCNKDYAYNHISARPSTRIHHPPGGGSSAGSLIFGSPGPAPVNNYKENVNKANNNNVSNDIDYKDKSADNVFIKLQSNNNAAMSDAEKVREFTYEAGQPCPERPKAMAVEEVHFITKMILDELLELYSTVLTPKQAKQAMVEMITKAKNVEKMAVSPNRSYELIAEQGDAFVDIWYYSLNAMAKKGVNLSKIFELVHDANMAKRDPQTGKFLKRDDGKIIKPKGWRAPNVSAEIKRQIENGSWK